MDDLVDDRELTAVEDDQLAHEGIVDQLAGVVSSVNTPSNIALYGPWGSGKSGVANLLQSKIDHKDGVRFVRFDAFKYADVPLRRNFISAVAKDLGCNANKYHSDLYSGRTKTDISIPPATIFKLLLVFAILMAGLTLILGVIVAVIAGVQQGDFWGSFRTLSGQVVLAGLLPATLLAALITLASKTFSVDRSLAKPESDEQFEELFRNLVADTKAKRLVVFIDELDRCSATEVVATLDTVRTFLGIKRCVFIIAADQNVLEEALTRAAKQETPASELNPYYSTGSAYLDKVFQYQISLPPLLTQSVSKYANTLVGGRGGIWADINIDYVLSVLIPTHVSSPRRVKHLLNTFALTYRLAEKRYRAGLLSENPQDSAAAVARLVCLRVEFPLFARNLEVDANLPSLVLQLVRDETTDFPSGVSDRAKELARAYALDGAAPATVLASVEESDEQVDSEQVKPIMKEHNKQLLNYLSRTRQVQGPSRHLIYMQSSGTVFGLDGDVAFAVEQAAENIDVETLQSQVAGLSEPDRKGVLELLSQQIRTGNGLIRPNTARSFLLLNKAMPGLHVDHVVDAVIEAICVLHDDATSILDEETITSAWSLTNSGSEAAAVGLRSRVVAVTVASDSEVPADFLLDDALIALDVAPTEMATYLASLLVSEDGPDTMQRLFAAPDGDVIRMLTILREPLAERANAVVKVHEEWTKAHKEWTKARKEVGSPANRSMSAIAAAAANPGDEPRHLGTLFSTLTEEAGSRETPVQHEMLCLLLAIDHQDARTAAEALIGRSEPTAQPELASSMLRASLRRQPERWPIWLEGIAKEAVRPEHAKLLNQLVAKLWSQDLPAADPSVALRAISPLVEALPTGRRPTLTTDILKEFEPLVTNAEEASTRDLLLAHMKQFAAAGFVDDTSVNRVIVSTLEDTLAQPLGTVDRTHALYQYVAVNGATALAACSDSISDEELDAILSEALTSEWLDQVGHIELPLILAAHCGRLVTMMDGVVTEKHIAELIPYWRGEATLAATLWASLLKPPVDALALILDLLLSEEILSIEFAEAAEQAHLAWTPAQRRAFLDRYLGQPDSAVPTDLTLRTIGLVTADDGEVADLLCKRFSLATNNAQRHAVVDLWAKAKISDTSARKRLFETVVYGLIDLHADGNRNASAVDIALTALDTLGEPLPHGVKGALGHRLKAVINADKTLEEKALRILPRLGYSTSRGILHKKRRVDYTDT